MHLILRLSTVFSFLFLTNILAGQVLSYSDTNLNTILQELDAKSDYSFNYDPSLIEGYTYTGQIELAHLKDSLSHVLRNTPFTYEIINNSFLVTLPDKKNYKLCGWVKDRSYDSDLIAANVYADGIDLGTLTDETGYFELEIQAYKDQKLTISYIGYISKEIIVGDLESDKCTKFYLSNDMDLIGSEIVIRDYIHAGITEGESYNSTSIDLQKAMKATGHDEHDVLKTVQILPGITSLDDSAGNLTIRGSTPDQNMLVWERATLYNSGHLFGMISTVNPFVLDKVNVYKGVFDPSHDNRIGGLVEMSLPDDMPNKISAGIGSSLSEVHAHLSSPINLPFYKNKLGIIVSTRKSANNFFRSPTINRYTEKVFQLTKFEDDLTQNEEDHRDDDEKINFSDTNLKIFYSPWNKMKIKFSFISSNNEFHSFSLLDDIESQDFINENTWAFSHDLSFQWSDRFNSTIFLVLSNYSFQYVSNIIDIGSEFDDEGIPNNSFTYSFNEVRNDIQDFSIGISNKFSLDKYSSLRVDAEIDQKDLSYEYFDQSEFELEYVDTGYQKGLFTNISAAFDHKTDRLKLMIGTKATYYHDKVERAFFSPRVSLQYYLNNDFKIKASAGKLYQFVNQVTLNDENDLGSLRNFWRMSNEDTEDVMNSNKFSAGIIWNKDGWLVDSEAYYNRSFGLSSLSANLNAGVDLNENGESTSIGLETLIQKRWNDYSIWFNYTLSENKYFFPETDMDFFPANNDHRHNLSLVNTYNYRDISLSLTYNFRSGLPYSTATGITARDIEDETYYELRFDQLNDARLKSYHRFDASISYRNSLFSNRLNIEANLSFVNVFDSRNVYTRNSYLIYDDASQEIPTIETYDKNLLRRTPKLLFRLFW